MGICDRYGNLPVAEAVGDICRALAEEECLLVTAPPGAGKSTLLPLALLENLPEGKILILEPRRIAALQIALRMADMLGEEVGRTVGYRVRLDTRVSSETRIEVVTEGVMERMLIEDPALEGVGIVIFDEYHERSLSSDLCLALVREGMGLLRPDLRIVVMSATIDATSLSRTLGARHINSPGRSHEVEIRYEQDYDPADCALVVARCIRRALRDQQGNILVFLPGQAEILKCRDILVEALCKEEEEDEDKVEPIEVMTLYGMMTPAQQRRVLAPSGEGVRRVVLASPIAETSLTLDGITVVVDSGLCRSPQFDPVTGLTRLVTSRITMDMATQRAGRAGRLSSGICYRLWSRATESRMKEMRQPEIMSADLSPMMLSVAAWGEGNPLLLPWVTPPPGGHLAEARRLLSLLGAIDGKGILTETGKRISRFPCHPRIARMLDGSGPLKSLACDVAALLEDKDPLQDETDADISSRIAFLDERRKKGLSGIWKRIDDISAQYRRLIHGGQRSGTPSGEEIGRLIAMAYPERVAMRDDKGHYRMASGNTLVTLHPADDLASCELLAVAAAGGRIYLAAPLGRDVAEKMARWVETAVWNSREGRAVVREELRIGLLTLATRPMQGDRQSLITAVIASAAPKEGRTMFDFNEEVQDLQLRIAVAAEWHPELELPDVTTDSLLATASEWLPLYIGRGSTVKDLRGIDMRSVIMGLLSYGQQQQLDRIVPTHFRLPAGRNVRIRYRRGAEAPVVSARLQDCFGLMETPRVDEGRRMVLMELLSPGFKPVQLTQDMAGFWRETYFEVRKELRRRYPKHKWPDNPLPE